MIKIIGFEFICNLFNVQYKDIADELGISKQTVNSWVSGRRKIPEKYLPILSEKFKIPKRFFQKELTELDKLKIQNAKLHREASEQIYGNMDIDSKIDIDEIEIDEHIKHQSEVECQLETLELDEAMKSVNKNLCNISNIEYHELQEVTYALKTFFDIYNFKESKIIGFSDILYFIANYLDIEGYRDEDSDDGLEYCESSFEYERVFNKKVEIFKKRLFKLLDYRKQIGEKHEQDEQDCWNRSNEEFGSKLDL